MPRKQFNDGQEIVFEDLNKLSSVIEKGLYDRIVYELVQRAEDAFFDDSLQVVYAAPTQVNVGVGVGFQTDATVDAAEPQKRLLYLGAAQAVNLVSADPVNDRIDIIVVKHARAATVNENRNFKAAGTGIISSVPLDVQNDWVPEILAVAGTPSGSPAVPATPAGYIKLAELLVSAVTGMSGSGAVTDTRTIMPIGGNATINSLAFSRLTQSAALSLQQALAEVDAKLVNGFLDDNVFVDLVTDPAAPAVAGDLKVYNKAGVLYTRDQGGAISPLGSGGGGGGAGAQWSGDALEEEEYSQTVKKFAEGGGAKETLYVKVPSGYLAGRQVSVKLGLYSPSASNEWNMQVVSTLIRKGQDAITSVANQETNNTGDITNDQADEFREVSVDVSTAIGQINAFGVSPGDLIKLELTRITPGGVSDSADVRLIPGATEVIFG